MKRCSGSVPNLHLSYFFKTNQLKIRNKLFLVFCFFNDLRYTSIQKNAKQVS